MEKLKISLAQLDVRLGKPEENTSRALAWIEQAAREGSQLILFPELWSSGYDLEHINAYAQFPGSELWKSLADQAKKCSITVGGTMIEKENDKYYNTSLLFGPKGDMLGRYRKIHLFRSIQEDRYFSPGDHLEMVDLDWGKTGLATCFDLRFPEIFREYALAGAKIILLPAEWPARRLEHWRTLIRARAIENQLFVIAVNACGYHQSEPYAGHSAVINPWGEAILEAGMEECLLTTEIDLAEIQQTRQRIPVFEDRRPDAYHL